MRRLAFNRLLLCAAATLAVTFFQPTTVATQISAAADETPAGQSATGETATGQSADTAAADTTAGEAPEKPGGRVKISIDESGISIEGRATVGTDEAEKGEDWVEVYDGRHRYREKGLDIVKFGESVFVAKDELVRGDLVVFAGNAMIEGRVGGNVVVIGGNIRARSGAVIKGDAVVIGGLLDEDDDVIITGERVTINDFFPANSFWLFSPEGRIFKFVFFPVRLFVQLVLAFLVLLFLRERILKADEHLADNYLKSFGVGLLSSFIAVFGLIVVSVLLLITIIGIPLAILLWISCAGILILAWTVFAFSLGRLVAKRLQIQSQSAFLMVFIGAVVINLPSVVGWGLGVGNSSLLAPLSFAFAVLGWFVKGFAYLAGIGALIMSRFGSRALAVGAQAAPTPPAPSALDAG
jgi:hypothetical protein